MKTIAIIWLIAILISGIILLFTERESLTEANKFLKERIDNCHKNYDD